MEVVPTPAPTESWLRWPPPGKEFWTRILQWALLITMLGCIVLIYFLGLQLRYESEASKFFKEGRYDAAAEKYQRAHDEARFFGRDRYLYFIGLSWINGGDKYRAMDYFVRLNKDYPDSYWMHLALPKLEDVTPQITGSLPPAVLKTNTRLAETRAQLNASYTKMISALKNFKSTNTVELEGEYVKYKKYYEAYRMELVRVHKAVEAGADPDKVDK